MTETVNSTGVAVSDFSKAVKAEIDSRGMSLRALAKAAHYDVSFISRVLSGKQKPSIDLAKTLDRLWGTQLADKLREPARIEQPSPNDYVRNAVAHFLEHDNRHGGDHVASAAKQVWKAEQKKLSSYEDKRRLADVAEIAEVAGWLLFDANRQEEARQAFMESRHLSELAGDKAMNWFALDMLAMQDVQNGNPGEALRISEELMTNPRVPGRVALLGRVRHARALALAGDRTRALDAVERAQGALQDSISNRDPQWAWWVDEMEVIGHRGEALISLGDYKGALPHLQRANELVKPNGRGALYYSVAELTALAQVGAWRESETTLSRIGVILESVASSRSRARLKGALRVIERDAPDWLKEHAREAVSLG
ncbi:helix-turn-helix transcriptional regulator [Streptomyces griseorubiginosus]|uniref:helix-turn-helix domain-containing protein n=1 Tax=Streptomyces griseorubiginosus TaxID=67304 RepID=UPI002E80AC4C|nr:helix-turn-helix transcriptional regulator [Streptomyces griseorubiginosus]WUB44561.1 helix-turn-helix transcriptional regulator [Streptomyces griseorubiginosus]WUB53078.1 helix-turn-helix transcriptional regulator [Streptomyces griseorubiginosus]